MRVVFSFGLVSALALTIGPVAAYAADPTGDWRVADGVANIRIAECNGALWGAVAWEKQPGGHDVNNPDASKKNRLTLGMPILIDMKKKPGIDQWEGEVYNAKDGKTYSSTIKPISPDQIEIQGCVLGFLCGGETWTRVAGPIPLSPANSMAKGAAPKTPASAKSAAAAVGANKMAAQNQKQMAPIDPVGDICLLPDIARFAH